jgi:hypothetical protein
MQNLKIFEKVPTIDIIKLLSDADEQGLQEYVNVCAYELACRIYVPNKSISFVKLLDDFGYKPVYEIKQVEEETKKLK